MQVTFTYQRVTLNGTRGWIASRRINGVFDGRRFGKTKTDAKEAFDPVIVGVFK